MQMIITFPNGLRIEVKDDGELQDLRPLVVKESETVSTTRILQEASSAPPETLQILEVPKTKKPEKVPLSEETRAEISRLSKTGLRPKEIGAMLGINGKRVNGIIRWPEVQAKGYAKRAKEITQKKIRESEPYPSPDNKDLDDRIIEMYSRLTCKEISAELEQEDINLTPKEISQRVKETQLRTLGQTVEQQVPEQVREAESIPVATKESRPDPVQDCAALQEEVGAKKEDPPERFVTPAKINGAIWDLHKAGLTPRDIAEHLNSRGLQWTEGMVEKRLEKIKIGAA